MTNSNPEAPRKPRLSRFTGLIVAAACAYSMSTLFSAMKPVLLTRFVEEAGFSESLSGLIVAMPFVGIAVASMLAGYLATRMSMRTLSLVFGLTLVFAELFSAWFFHLSMPVIVAQLAGGIAVGVLMGASSRIIATTTMPDQIFGFVDMTAVFLMSFMIAGVGAAVEDSGLHGGYLFAAAISLLFTLLMLQYRDPPKVATGTDKQVPPLRITLRPVAVILMGMLFVTCSGLGFAFMFTIAIDLARTAVRSSAPPT